MNMSMDIYKATGYFDLKEMANSLHMSLTHLKNTLRSAKSTSPYTEHMLYNIKFPDGKFTIASRDKKKIDGHVGDYTLSVRSLSPCKSAKLLFQSSVYIGAGRKCTDNIFKEDVITGADKILVVDTRNLIEAPFNIDFYYFNKEYLLSLMKNGLLNKNGISKETFDILLDMSNIIEMKYKAPKPYELIKVS